MSNAGSVIAVTPQTQTSESKQARANRLFYLIAGSVMFIVTAVGFQAFILRGKGFGGGEMTRPIVPLIVAHGLAMFSWVTFFLLQSVLIFTGNRRLHTVIGPAGGVIAAAIVILGTAVAALSVHFNPQIYQPFGGARSFLAIMLTEIVTFGTFVGLGLHYRRRPEIHRPIMLLATLCIISGSLARSPYISQLAVLPPLYVYVPTLLFGALFFSLQWVMTGTANRWYAIGYAGIVLTFLVSVAVGHSGPWNQLVAPFVP